MGLIVVAGVAWLVFQLISRWGERMRLKTLAGSGYRKGSLIVLGQRIIKVVVAIRCRVTYIFNSGFDMTAAVAGFGVGSIANAFAAQKTLEELVSHENGTAV